MRKLGVGVLGVGEMGRRHAENLRRTGAQAPASSQWPMSLPSERSRPPRNSRSTNPYGSLEAMLECKGLDAVVIATPDKFHAAGIKLAPPLAKIFSARSRWP